MNPRKNSNNVPAALDRLIDEITVDAYGDDEQLWAFRQAFEDDVNLPADGFVIGEPVEEWAMPIIARGPRPEFEMEQVLPGADTDDPFEDPIIQSNELKDTGDGLGAKKILMELCQSDLRCLDAHAHLGHFSFDNLLENSIRHYEVGLRIGELSLGDGFDGVLHWGLIDNRPFLRCMQGYGLCLWRLGHFDDAECVFDRMLWLNPSDNQGVRFLIDDVRLGTMWEEREFK